MSEPKRWLEQGASRDIERLIAAARAEAPTEGSLHRTLSAVGVGVAVSSAAGSAAASAGSAGTVTGAGATQVSAAITGSVLAKWTALGATVGTLGIGGAAIVTRLPSEAKAPTPSLRSPAPPRPSSVLAVPAVPARRTAEHREPTVAYGTATTAVVSNPVAPLDATTAAALSPERLRHAGTGAVPPPGVPLEAETLAEEVKSVDHARAALAAGRPRQALLLLDEYERRFHPRGFAPEALYLRMEALTSLGQTAQARAAAERLLASYPNSPQAARARLLLSKNP